VALIGYLPVENVLAQLLEALGTIAPSEVLALLRAQLDEVARGSYASVLTLGIVGAIWSSSAAMVAIIDALNHAYDIEERRPWWKRRIVAIVLTVALALFIVTSLVLMLVGPDVASLVAGWVGLGPAFSWFWPMARWPLMIVLVVLGVDLVYYFAPNRRGRWVWITPGSLLATALWMASSFAFKFYVTNLANFNATYGAIGGVVVLLLWFYVSGRDSHWCRTERSHRTGGQQQFARHAGRARHDSGLLGTRDTANVGARVTCCPQSFPD
jgi:membrane protein